jgi:ABC-type oligopeptide transport system substrate-binding subunit
MSAPTSYAVPEQLITQYPGYESPVIDATETSYERWLDHLQDNGGFGGDIFKVTQWNHVGDLILKRNDAFWGTHPTLSDVDVKFYKNATTAYSAYRTGLTDVGVAPVAQLAQAQKRKTFHQIATQQIDYYAMNWKQAPFNDILMRQAFALALDKQALAQTTYHGAVIATNHIVPLGTPGYNPTLLGPDGTTGLTGNLALAHREATTYAIETKCGTATDFSHCPPVVLTLESYTPEVAQAEALAARQMWLQAMPGYPITITQCCTDLLTTTDSRLQFWQVGWVEDYPDPQDGLSTNLECASLENMGSACDPQAEQLLVTDVAWIPLDQTTTWWETGPGLQGFTIAADGLIPRNSWQTIYRNVG